MQSYMLGIYEIVGESYKKMESRQKIHGAIDIHKEGRWGYDHTHKFP